MDDQDNRPRLSFGFALAGLLSAGLAYFAFDYGVFAGPVWRNVLAAVAIGGGAAALLLAAERRIFKPKGGRRAVDDRAKIKGPWGCPRCGAAYVPEATECSDCHVPLTSREA